MHEVMRNAYKILTEKLEEKRQFGRLRCNLQGLRTECRATAVCMLCFYKGWGISLAAEWRKAWHAWH